MGEFLTADFSGVGNRLRDGLPLAQVPHLIRGNAKFRAQKRVTLLCDETYLTEMSLFDRVVFHVVSKAWRLARKLNGACCRSTTHMAKAERKCLGLPPRKNSIHDPANR